MEYGIHFGIGGLPKNAGHDIEFIVEQLNDVGFTFQRQDELVNWADTITNWEESGRYGSGIRTSAQTVHKSYNIYDNVLSEFLERQ